jgi:dTDP-4-dehydrorhamnose reductase
MVEAVVSPVEALPEVLAAPHPFAQLRSRVLITGATGMLGSDLTPVLAGAGCDVFARGESDLDITREEEIVRAFRELRPDVLVNCAAFTNVDAAETDPRAFQVNAEAVHRLAEACIRHSCRLIQISTDFVFDGEKREPYREEDPKAPLSEYGRTKALGEEAALGVPAGLVVRTSWLFGLGGWNFIEAILKQIEQGRSELQVVADQRGKPTSTADLAQAILGLLMVGAVGIYHFANRGEVTWYEFARDILDLAGRSDVPITPIRSASLGRPAARPAYSVLDTAKYERITGQPIRDFREPLAEYLDKRAHPA